MLGRSSLRASRIALGTWQLGGDWQEELAQIDRLMRPATEMVGNVPGLLLTRVGLLGVGLMGTAMAHRLLDRGFAVSVWDRDASSRRGPGRAGSAPGGPAPGGPRRG